VYVRVLGARLNIQNFYAEATFCSSIWGGVFSRFFGNEKAMDIQMVALAKCIMFRFAPQIHPLGKHSETSSVLSSDLFQGKFFKSNVKCGRIGGEAEIQDGAIGGAWVALKLRVRID
jgi:hypothetical protein